MVSHATGKRNARARRSAPRAAATLFALLLVVGVASIAHAEPLPQTGSGPYVSDVSAVRNIVGLELRRQGDTRTFEIVTDGPVIWTSFRDGSGRLVVELPNSEPTADVIALDLSDDLVRSGRLTVVAAGQRPMSRLLVDTVSDVSHAVVPQGQRLVVELTPTPANATGPGATYRALDGSIEVENAAVFEDESGPESPKFGPAPSGVPATQLQGVDVTTGDSGTTIWIAGDGAFYYSHFPLTDPYRFVIDLIGVVNTSPISAIAVQGELVDKVRVAQYKPQPELVSRVVIDLVSPVMPSVEETPDGLKIAFDAVAAEMATEAMAAAEPQAEPETETVEASTYYEEAAVAEVVAEEVAEAEPMEAVEEVAEAEPMEAVEEVEEAVEMASDMATEMEPATEAVAEVEYTEPEMDASMESEMAAEVEEAVETWEEVEAAPTWEAQDEAEVATEEVVAVEWEETEEAATWEEVTPAADTMEEPMAEPAETATWDEPVEAPTWEEADPEPEAPGSLFNMSVDLTPDVVEEEDPSGFGTRDITVDTDTGFTGEPMTLSLQDADIKDVLRSFAQISGLNVVVQPGVTGAVTVEFVDVPWDQALDQILKINGLAHQLEGSIMRVAPISVLRAEAEEKARLEAAKTLSVPLKTILRRVSYAGAGEIAAILRSGGDASIMSERGSVLVDGRTNTLIIKELPSHINTVIAVIENLDIPEPQVMIEARIIETTKRFSQTLGIQLGFNAISSAERGNTTGLQFPNNGTADGGVNLLTGGSNGFLDITLGNVLNTFNLDALLQAAESEGLINILSAPRITTLNNEQASIQSGLQIPIQTIANNTVSVQFVNATLRLEVTPHVTAEGTVLMDIDIQKREPQLAFAVVGASNAPISTKDASTRVIVRDGGTTVIGGIYKVTSDQGEDRVPGLSNVPILKHLFKNKRRNDENEELLIFITPRVVKL